METTNQVVEFKSFSKIPRLSRLCVITEKVDGTNAQVYIPENPLESVLAGSRTRWLYPTKQLDNFGFATWVKEHEEELRQLGPGRHFGEWYGSGIQRNYGLAEKKFALFNWRKFGDAKIRPACCGIVPIICSGIFDDELVNFAMKVLKDRGSYIVPGFMNPEGIVIEHTQARALFKKTFEGDDSGKETEAAS